MPLGPIKVYDWTAPESKKERERERERVVGSVMQTITCFGEEIARHEEYTALA